MKNTQGSELRYKVSDVLKKLVRDMIVRGKDWPLGRKSMRTNAADEIIEVVSASSNQALLQKVTDKLEKQSEYWLNRFKQSRAGTNEVYLERSTFIKNLISELEAEL